MSQHLQQNAVLAHIRCLKKHIALKDIKPLFTLAAFALYFNISASANLQNEVVGLKKVFYRLPLNYH